MLDTRTGRLDGYRLDERFAMLSTFKLPLAAMVLQSHDKGELSLDRLLSISQADLRSYAPLTTQHVGQGMTIEALAHATLTTSDGVASNLLVQEFGGPQKFTEFCRALGDSVTRLDRMEPELNCVAEDDPRDTSTPRAMAQLLAVLVAGDALSESSRKRLVNWMRETNTGLKRLRAGFPVGWGAGDKTGTTWGDGLSNKYGDIAAAWPTNTPAALLVTAFYDSKEIAEDIRPEDEAIFAHIGRIAGEWYQAGR